MSDLFPAQYKLFHYFIIYGSEDTKFILKHAQTIQSVVAETAVLRTRRMN